MAIYFKEQKNNQISKKQKRKEANSDDSDSDSSSDSNSDMSDLELDFHKGSDNSGTDVDDSNPFGNDSDSDEGRNTWGWMLFQWWGKYFTHFNVDQKDGSGAIIIFLTNVNVE